MTFSKQRLQLTSGAADSSERRSDKQPCKRDGVNVCFTSLQERWEEWGLVFFLPPPSIHRNPEAAESRLSPRWGIHKVQQMKTKRFQLPLVAGNGSDFYWGGHLTGSSAGHAAPVLSELQRLFLQCHLSSAAHISIQANLIPSNIQLHLERKQMDDRNWQGFPLLIIMIIFWPVKKCQQIVKMFIIIVSIS